ncbi:Hypothetical predicted protein [Cloeon dipterum]|uniref:Uncharacterized protein n=1 Tax=Cloeon dipterum TaxID=197152 RepID=A0A8S1CNA4_9INSE|nr:Hypothetical predicted protein [Cloeon dipterum]
MRFPPYSRSIRKKDWLAVPNYPPEIYLTDRLACYNSGRHMKSQNRLSSEGYLNSMKIQTKGMHLELTKFTTTFTRSQQGAKNVVFLLYVRA